jgi:hypothetical protein
MVHTAVVLPRDLLERLKKDAVMSGGGLSTVIRQRLKLTYDLQGLPRDPETNDLIESIKKLADNLAGDLGMKWHEHPYALAAFKAGVAEFLVRHQPEGNPTRRPDSPDDADRDDQPDSVGRTHARLIRIAKHEDKDE